MGWFNNHFRRLFYKLGEQIGRKPEFFIVSSIFVALFFTSGLAFVKWDDDFDKLFSTRNGATDKEMNIVDKYFKSGELGSFDPSRRTRIGAYARLIIEAKDGGTLFRKSVWDEILQIDELVHSAAPEWRHNYSSLCGKWDGECFENKFLDLGQVMDQIENGSLRVNYPIMFNPETFKTHVIPIHFGGISLSNDSLSVDEVQAVSLYYFLEVGTDVDLGFAWEQEIIDGIDYARPFWTHINVYLRTVRSDRLAHVKILTYPLPYFNLAIMFMIVFIAISVMSNDCVRSKFWVAVMGLVCSLFGTLAGFGLVSFLGLPVINLLSTLPFIMGGIGIDDTFVILAAWRQTNVRDPVPTRLAHCYSEAGASITITTLTDMLSFYVGIMTPVEGLQIFSAYAGTCVIWIYLFQVFMLGACLAIGGRQEALNRHGIFWWMEATPKSKADGKSKFHKLFFTGGINKSDPTNIKDQSQNGVMLWFQTTFSTFLLKAKVQALVIVVFLCYIGISAYGLTTLDKGLNIKEIFPWDSPMHTIYDKNEQYFQDYPYRVQVLITTPLDYHNKTVQNQVSDMLSQMNATEHIALEYSENWLEAYMHYLKIYSDIYDLNVTDSRSFIDTLRGNFLNGSSSRIRADVKFNEDNTEIEASRFILQTKNGSTSVDLKNLVIGLRAVAENQTAFNVTVYNPFFATTDLDIVIEKLTFQLMGAACIAVMAIAVLFIPSILCSFLVFVAMLTTELGVVGLMSLWGLNLDILSLLGLVVCIGFAVDFTAHVSYCYISTDGTPEDRLRKTMYALGYPILQGAFSTVIGIFALFFLNGYSYQVLAKIITLVIISSAFHGLFVLPVVLVIFRPERFSCGANKSSSISISESSKGKTGFDLNTIERYPQTEQLATISRRIIK